MTRAGTDWSAALASLTCWHESRDRRAADRALSVIESWLRTRIPPIARRRWSPEELDDVLQGFLERLLNKPLPTDIDNADAYLYQAFRRWCIDHQRGRKNDLHEPWEDAAPGAVTHQDPVLRERLERASEALRQLRIEDRVVIKLFEVPYALTWDELGWLAHRSGLSPEEVRDQALTHHDQLGLSLIFDPGPVPVSAKDRRDRLERFRRRRSRARQKLRQLMGEAP